MLVLLVGTPPLEALRLEELEELVKAAVVELPEVEDSITEVVSLTTEIALTEEDSFTEEGTATDGDCVTESVSATEENDSVGKEEDSITKEGFFTEADTATDGDWMTEEEVSATEEDSIITKEEDLAAPEVAATEEELNVLEYPTLTTARAATIASIAELCVLALAGPTNAPSHTSLNVAVAFLCLLPQMEFALSSMNFFQSVLSVASVRDIKFRMKTPLNWSPSAPQLGSQVSCKMLPLSVRFAIAALAIKVAGSMYEDALEGEYLAISTRAPRMTPWL